VRRALPSKPIRFWRLVSSIAAPRGSRSKMLATGGVVANEVFVATLQPLQRGEERYALSFAVPMSAKGLKMLSRKSYEAASRTIFDNPLASRYDENDSVPSSMT